jgi:hypothetical protein
MNFDPPVGGDFDPRHSRKFRSIMEVSEPGEEEDINQSLGTSNKISGLTNHRETSLTSRQRSLMNCCLSAGRIEATKTSLSVRISQMHSGFPRNPARTTHPLPIEPRAHAIPRFFQVSTRFRLHPRIPKSLVLNGFVSVSCFTWPPPQRLHPESRPSNQGNPSCSTGTCRTC